jgi:hypothetical protein
MNRKDLTTGRLVDMLIGGLNSGAITRETPIAAGARTQSNIEVYGLAKADWEGGYIKRQLRPVHEVHVDPKRVTLWSEL